MSAIDNKINAYAMFALSSAEGEGITNEQYGVAANGLIKAENVSFTFANNSNLTSFLAPTYINCTNFSNMFAGDEYLQDFAADSLVTINASNLVGMFGYCSRLKVLNLSGWHTTENTLQEGGVDGAFRDCSNLATIYVSDMSWTTVKPKFDTPVFASCKKLIGGDGTTYSTETETYNYAQRDNATQSGLFTYKNAPGTTEDVAVIKYDKCDDFIQQIKVGDPFTVQGRESKQGVRPVPDPVVPEGKE